ncbi:hypothetical protein D3C84_1006060 [compost metagenome]
MYGAMIGMIQLRCCCQRKWSPASGERSYGSTLMSMTRPPGIFFASSIHLSLTAVWIFHWSTRTAFMLVSAKKKNSWRFDLPSGLVSMSSWL